MSYFDLIAKEVESGLEGKNSGIPMGFERLNRYVGIRRRIMTLIFGSTGSGKSAFMHSAYILHPFDYLREHPSDLKFKVILFSMERSKVYILAKWISRRIFLTEGVFIPIPKIMGWWEHKKLTPDEHDLFLTTKSYIDELSEIVDIIDGPQNPTGIYKYVKEYAEANGKIEHITEYKKVYVPNHPNEIVMVMEDHLGLTKQEKGQTKKEAIDKVSEYNQMFRDLYGYCPIPVSQLTRNLNNPIYHKMDSFEPTIDDKPKNMFIFA